MERGETEEGDCIKNGYDTEINLEELTNPNFDKEIINEWNEKRKLYLTKENILNFIPKKTIGVYAIYYMDIIVVYVGKSIDIRSRLITHLTETMRNIDNKEFSFRYIEKPLEKLNAWEQYFIIKFHPIHNLIRKVRYLGIQKGGMPNDRVKNKAIENAPLSGV